MVLKFILLIRTEIFNNFLTGLLDIILNISVTAWRFNNSNSNIIIIIKYNNNL